MENNFFKNSKIYTVVLIVLLVAGFLVRMIDLTDPPLDFHPTRQLREAVIARRIYLSIDPGADPELAEYATDPALYDYVTRREPPVTEAVVAFIYLLIGKETLWVSRIVTSIFWCGGGLGLYFLVKKLTSKEAGLLSLGFYLFAPFGVIASRSFQPEALMVAGMIWSLLCFVWWLDERTWKSALIAGLVSGFTIFVKPNPLFILFPVYLLLLITSDGFKAILKNWQAWAIAGLSAVIPFIFYFFVNPSAGGFLDTWWADIERVIPTSRYFLGWGSIVTDIIPFAVLVIALASTLMFGKRGRALSIGMWVGYVILGIFVPYHIYTHNYYSIVLVPITAIAASQIFQIVAEKAAEQKRIWRFGLILVAIFAIGYSTWNVYKDLNEKDYRGEPAGWKLIGEALPEDQKILALTHNYGFNLAYYGERMLDTWPYSYDLRLQGQEFRNYFETVTEPYDLFLVTHFADLQAQPKLQDKLSTLEIFAEGPGYILYQLPSE